MRLCLTDAGMQLNESKMSLESARMGTFEETAFTNNL